MINNKQSNRLPFFPIKEKYLRNTNTHSTESNLPEVLFITSYPPRQCGIATYSHDLITAINNKFSNAYSISIAALESKNEKHVYDETVKYILDTDNQHSYGELAKKINNNQSLELILIQHEFGFFRNNEAVFLRLLENIRQPIIIVFHTVLPGPDNGLKKNVQQIDASVQGFMVMTKASAEILERDYGIASGKITVIPHGTHLVKHADKEILKRKYGLSGRKVISTFGLLSSGKSIETTLHAMPAIVNQNPDVIFLIIGKTHPSVVESDGENYRDYLERKITMLEIQQNVKFINAYLPLEELLEYLQLTDIYLFTSNDPNQAVSGTFSYAISCGCPVISTPIPHARELLNDGEGIIIGFGNSLELEIQVNFLLNNEELRKSISSNGIHKLAPTSWENTAIAHILLFETIIGKKINRRYKIPHINLDHFRELTTEFGIIQFAVINKPDFKSGYTLDDNSRALVAICKYFKLTHNPEYVTYISRYYRFIRFCLQDNGEFMNYVDTEQKFTEQNIENLEDANGRAIWALGYLLSISPLLPEAFIKEVKQTMQSALCHAVNMHSTRAMAFTIKGLFYRNKNQLDFENITLIELLSDRLVQMYRHESKLEWNWFESSLTYGNSILPEAMLCAYLATGKIIYKEIAKKTFDFLISKTFTETSIKVISNKGWLQNNDIKTETIGGEQPIDVAYTILALAKFYNTFKNTNYLKKMETAFSWFLGNNHLHQIIYNPCTGGCYDGLEENYINLNQGAESTVSYLLARLTIENYPSRNTKTNHLNKIKENHRVVKSV